MGNSRDASVYYDAKAGTIEVDLDGSMDREIRVKTDVIFRTDENHKLTNIEIVLDRLGRRATTKGTVNLGGDNLVIEE